MHRLPQKISVNNKGRLEIVSLLLWRNMSVEIISRTMEAVSPMYMKAQCAYKVITGVYSPDTVAKVGDIVILIGIYIYNITNLAKIQVVGIMSKETLQSMRVVELTEGTKVNFVLEA